MINFSPHLNEFVYNRFFQSLSILFLHGSDDGKWKTVLVHFPSHVCISILDKLLSRSPPRNQFPGEKRYQVFTSGMNVRREWSFRCYYHICLTGIGFRKLKASNLLSSDKNLKTIILMLWMNNLISLKSMLVLYLFSQWDRLTITSSQVL